MLHHLWLRGRVYYYYRRTPAKFLPFTGRKSVCFSLETDSHKQAIRLSGLESAKLENYWKSLAATGGTQAENHLIETLKRAELYGFVYKPMAEIVTGCPDELADRVNFVAESNFQPLPAEAVLGSVKKPQIMLSDAVDKFWEFRPDIRIEKSEKEARKWINARRRAVKNFITVNGDKPVKKVCREDMLKFRDWWCSRIEDEEYSPATANKDFRHTKAVVSTVAKECGMKFSKDEISDIFSDLEFNDDNLEGRKPFTTDFILNTLLAAENLDGLEHFEIAMIKVFAETGVSISELVKLHPEDIMMDQEIPYLEIKPRFKMQLKTIHRKRRMPLIGFALDVFREYPQGFRKYNPDADIISTNVNAHFRHVRKIYPSEKHSLYSLRHSFQDRLTNNKVDRRIQLDLMGHKFPGEKYGEGGWLETVYAEMKSIQLKPE